MTSIDEIEFCLVGIFIFMQTRSLSLYFILAGEFLFSHLQELIFSFSFFYFFNSLSLFSDRSKFLLFCRLQRFVSSSINRQPSRLSLIFFFTFPLIFGIAYQKVFVPLPTSISSSGCLFLILTEN